MYYPAFAKFLLLRRSTAAGGFSLLEGIVTIVIIGIVLGFLAPLVFLVQTSSAQNRRFEQALALAQQELDRVQAELARGVSVAEETEVIPAATAATVLASTPAPTATVQSYSDIANVTDALPVDVDGDGDDDFLVQTFRSQGLRFGSGTALGQLALFQLGVRVYSVEAIRTLDASGTLEIEPLPVNLTSSLGAQATRPLVATYSQVSRGDNAVTLDVYQEYTCSLPGSSC